MATDEAKTPRGPRETPCDYDQSTSLEWEEGISPHTRVLCAVCLRERERCECSAEALT